MGSNANVAVTRLMLPGGS